MHRCLFKQLTQTLAGLVEKVASVYTISPFHILSPSLSSGSRVTKWLDGILSNLTVQHLAFGWRLVLVSPQVELASSFCSFSLWTDCLCLRSCYCFVSSMSVVGLQLAHWGCHYHSFWTWPLTKRPNINNHLRSPVSNTLEAWKCVLPSCLGGRALAGRLDGPGQENQGHKRG